MGMPSFGSSLATAWPSIGATSTATGWTLPGQPVFPTPTSGTQGLFTGQSMGGAPPPQYRRHCSTEANPPHHTMTTASSTGHSVHPSHGCSQESFLCLQNQYLLRYPLLLFRNGKGFCLWRWTTTRLLYREVIYTFLIWTLETTGSIPENALKESTQEGTRMLPNHW